MVIFAMVSDMLKLARLFILTLFILCNYSYADVRVEVGDDAEAFEEVFLEDANLSQEEKNVLRGYHQKIKEHHNKYVGPGDYEEIHLSRRDSGSLESAIKFKHPEGGDFVYQFVVRKTKNHFTGYKMSRGPKVFGAYKETVALNDARDKHNFVKSKEKLFKDMNDQVFSDRLYGLDGKNFEKLSDSEIKKEFNSMFKKMHADKLDLNRHSEALRQDEHLKEMQHDMSSISEAMRDRSKKGKEKRDEINDRYKQFRARFNTFYNMKFSSWSGQYKDAQEHMKSTPKLSKRHPGKFKSRESNTKGFERDVVEPVVRKRKLEKSFEENVTRGFTPADEYPSESNSTKGRSFDDINKEEKGFFGKAWSWFSGADQKTKHEKQSQGGTKTDGRPSSGSAPRSQKKEDLINKNWRKDGFLNRSHKRGSGWVSGAAEDAVDDANDDLINH